MERIVIVEREGCPDCVRANEALDRLRTEDPSLQVRHIESARAIGRQLIASVHAGEVPVVFVDGQYVGQGAIDETLLRERVLGAAPAGRADGPVAATATSASAHVHGGCAA